MSQQPNLVEATFSGYGFADTDVEDLAEAFSPVGPTRAVGQWAPAAVPEATVDIVITFLGQSLLEMFLEKALTYVWHEVSAAWNQYRDKRRARLLADPKLGQLTVRGDDFELFINGSVDLMSPAVIEALDMLAERRSSGILQGFPIRRITMPCVLYEGNWDRLDPYFSPEEADFLVWYVDSRCAEPMSSFYDARADSWIPWSL